MADDNKGDVDICRPEDPEAPRKPLHEEALDECVEEFVRGVHSFHGNRFHSDLTVPDDVIEKIKDTFAETFRQRLDPSAERQNEDAEKGGEERPVWAKSGKRVRRIAFYAGSLAACFVHGDSGRLKSVDYDRAEGAIKCVSAYCRGKDSDENEVRPLWIFCPWPSPKEDAKHCADDSAQQGHEDA